MKINVTGGIGYDFTAETLREKLNSHTGDFELHINSPGGDIYDGIEIYNEIMRYRRETGSKVTAYFSGFVASAASYLSMAASERIAYDNSVFMLHNASMVAIGDNRVFQFWADDLKKTDRVIAKAYSKVTGKSETDILELMASGEDNNGTYLYGEEIKEAGFADQILDSEDGGDKENKTKESKILYANFQKNAKAKEYDHDRIVALVKDFEIQNNAKPNSREADKKGESMSKKIEALDTLKVFKENGELTLKEAAVHLGLESQVITDEQKKNLSAFGKIKSLSGETDPVEFVNGLIAEREENAVKVRKAMMTEEFGPEKHPETGKENKVRTYADKVLSGKELNEETLKELKEDSIYKSLKAEQADVNSEWNRIETKENTNSEEKHSGIKVRKI